MVADGRHTGYLFPKKLARTTTEDVCKQLRVWFLNFGWPRAIRTDGGPQFREPVVEFCKANCVTHELSSAYNHESNGLAEVGVRRAKELLEKVV